MTKIYGMRIVIKKFLLTSKRHISILFLLFIGNLFSQTIITDRPDQTESSSTIEKGSLQIESGALLGYIEENATTQKQVLAPSTLFRLGIAQGIELRVLHQLESNKNQEDGTRIKGICDLEVGTKIQILRKENKSTEVAFLSHLIIPTGSTSVSADAWGTINKFAISHPLTDNLGLGYNIGYNYFSKGSGDLTYSIALGYGLTERVSIYIEPYGHLAEFEKHISNFDTGFTYLVKDNLQFDFSFGTGINHTMNYIALGFSWNIKRKG